MDAAFRSIEHILRLFLLNKIEDDVPDDFDHILQDLRIIYGENLTIISALGHISDFRHSWAHGTPYDYERVCLALDTIRVEGCGTTLDDDLSFHIMMDITKELVKVIGGIDVKRKVLRTGSVNKIEDVEKGLDSRAQSFIPMNILLTEPDARYRPMLLSQFRETEELRNFIKRKVILIMDGKYTGKKAKFVGWKGNCVKVKFVGDDGESSIPLVRKVRVCMGE